MDDNELKVLNKDMRKKKRIATELAGQIHDVVEDTLWSDYPKLIELSEKTIAACEAYKLAQEKLESISS